MGSLISRFKKDKTSLQALETLQEEIESIESEQHTTILKQKKYVGKLIVYSVLVYLLFALLFYVLAIPSSLRDGAIYAAPLVLIPVIVFAAQKLIKLFFKRKIMWNTEKLADLRAKKKKILDEVMDKETFRVAREILEKYAPDQLRKSDNNQSKLNLSVKKSPIKKEETPKEVNRVENNELIPEKEPLRRASDSGVLFRATTNPLQEVARSRPYQMPQPTSPSHFQPPPMMTSQVLSQSQKRRLARPILDPVGSRGFVDRLIEHLVGDGPANRYALICSHCSSHNGMALKEEFEYISFRCAYCGFPNPSRKVMSKRNSSASTQDVQQLDNSSSTEAQNEESEVSTDNQASGEENDSKENIEETTTKSLKKKECEEETHDNETANLIN